MVGKNLTRYIKNPQIIFFGLSRKGKLKWLPDKMFLKIGYRLTMKKKLNLKDPKTLNEKLQWLKLYDRNPEYTKMVDKYEAKRYVAERVGEKYIIPLLGVWDSFDEIDFDRLPDQFVLKCTHDCGGLVICQDKSKLDLESAKKKIVRSLRNNYYWQSREWPYKDVKPRIIAEKYMVDESGTELKDYKVMCFHGEPKIIQLHKGRYSDHTQDFYSAEWEKYDIYQGCPQTEGAIEKPVFLEEMLAVSRKLSKDIPCVRADWYCVDGQLYFGELTFFDASGFCAYEPEEWDYTLGSWVNLK